MTGAETVEKKSGASIEHKCVDSVVLPEACAPIRSTCTSEKGSAATDSALLSAPALLASFDSRAGFLLTLAASEPCASAALDTDSLAIFRFSNALISLPFAPLLAGVVAADGAFDSLPSAGLALQMRGDESWARIGLAFSSFSSCSWLSSSRQQHRHWHLARELQLWRPPYPWLEIDLNRTKSKILN